MMSSRGRTVKAAVAVICESSRGERSLQGGGLYKGAVFTRGRSLQGEWSLRGAPFVRRAAFVRSDPETAVFLAAAGTEVNPVQRENECI
jgi:hypothetical protein